MKCLKTKLMKPIEKGLVYETKAVVREGDLASTHKSGLLDVYATPAMVAFMEETSCRLLEPYMEEGETTVGIAIDVKHLKATLIGMNVYCKSHLVEVDGRRFVFEIEVRDDASLIGQARHERFLVYAEAFMEKAMKNKLQCNGL